MKGSWRDIEIEETQNLKEIIDIGECLKEISENKGWKELKQTLLEELDNLSNIMETSIQQEEIIRCFYTKRGIQLVLNLYDEMLSVAVVARNTLEAKL
jgi:hypothetical protein